MKRKWAAGMLAGVFVGTAALSGAAWAGPAGHLSGGDWGKAAKSRSARVGQANLGRGAAQLGSGRNLERLGRAVNDARRGGDTPILDALRGGSKHYGYGHSDTPILDELRDRYYRNNGYHGGRYGYHDDDVADAYRDAAIANAVVNLVGIAVTAATQPRVAAVAQPVAVAPAPVAVVQPAPRGYYETREVVVSEGYYEDVRVWVPEVRDSRGRVVQEGYYEIRKRWNPPVHEYRPVWVETR